MGVRCTCAIWLATGVFLLSGCSRKASDPEQTRSEEFDTPIAVSPPGEGDEQSWSVDATQPPTDVPEEEPPLKFEVRDGKLTIGGSVSPKDRLVLTQPLKPAQDTRIEFEISHRLAAGTEAGANAVPEPVQKDPSDTTGRIEASPPIGIISLFDETSKKGAAFYVLPTQVMVIVQPLGAAAAPPETPAEGEAPQRVLSPSPEITRMVAQIVWGSWHRYRIAYDPVALEVKMYVDGKLVLQQKDVLIPKPVIGMGTLGGLGESESKTALEAAEFDDLEIKS